MASVQTVTFVRPAGTVMVQLESADGGVFTIPEDVAVKFGTVKNLLEDMEADDGFYPVIPLPSVKSVPLGLTLEYLLLEETKGQAETETPSVQLTDWQNDFCKTLTTEQCFECILTANYLEYKPLLDVLCKNVANMIKGKTPAEIRAIFGVDREFTAEEKAQVMKENPWLMDDEPTSK